MILPARLAVTAETGTSTRARQVSRQFSQRAIDKQLIARNGSRITLLNRVFNPCASESISLVNRAINSDEPWSLKLERSSARVRRKKWLRMSNRVNCITSATSTS